MNLRSLPIIPFALEAHGSHLVFQNEAKNIPRQDFLVMNISCKFEMASFIFLLER